MHRRVYDDSSVNNKDVLTISQSNSCLYMNYLQSIVHDSYYKQAQPVIYVNVFKRDQLEVAFYSQLQLARNPSFPPIRLVGHLFLASRYVRQTYCLRHINFAISKKSRNYKCLCK